MLLRVQWVCSGCDVLVRNTAGVIPTPKGWVQSETGMLCVHCQREAARNGAGEDSGSKAVLRHELLRGTPLAKAAGLAAVSEQSARAVRTAMVRRGEIDPTAIRSEPKAHVTRTAAPRIRSSAPGLSPEKAQRREAIEAALRENPDEHNEEIAARVGSSSSTVQRRRRALGIPPATPRKNGRRPAGFTAQDAATLRKSGPVSIEQFSKVIDRTYATARCRLTALVDRGLATVEGTPTRSGATRKYRAA